MNNKFDLVKNISLSSLENYLSFNEWIQNNKISDLATIWHRKEDQYFEFEILLPTKTTLKDYINRIKDVVDVLSEFEGKHFEEVVCDIQNLHSDLIKIRVSHEDVKDGKIPIKAGISLFENAKDLLLSAIRSTFEKRKYFAGGKLSDDILNYLDCIQLGQTEKGSYVINIITPLNFNVASQDDFTNRSLTRLVSNTLTNSLSQMSNLMSDFKSDFPQKKIDESVGLGVSANLCDALIGLSGKFNNRDVSITVSLSSTEPAEQNSDYKFNFDSLNVDYLKSTSDYLKGGDLILTGKVISGYVFKLMHKDDSDFGSIEIDTTIDEVDKKVRIELPTEKYWEAHSAHKTGSCVECKGDLIISPRSAKLINIIWFNVIETDDIFE